MHESQRSSAQIDNDPESGISIIDYLLILLDEWRTVVVPFVLCVLATVAYLILAVPKYTAQGVVQVSTGDATGTEELLNLATGQPSPVETEVEILKSRRILGKAVQNLGLNIVQEVPKISVDLRVSLGGKSPLNPDLVALRTTVRNLTVADWVETPVPASFSASPDGGLKVRMGGKNISVPAGGRFDHEGISFELPADKNRFSGKNVEVAILPADVAAMEAQAGLKVQTIGGGRRETNLVAVEYQNSDRVVARDFVNALMEAYMSFALDWRTLRADRSAVFIEKQLETVSNGLENSEKEIQEFVESNGAVLLPEQAGELIRSGSELELEMRKVKIQEELLTLVVSGMSYSKKMGKSSSLTGDFLFEDELLGQVIGALNELEMKRETLLSEVTEAHPEVVRLTDEIVRIRSQVQELIKASRNRISERRQAISRELDTIQQELSGFPDKERQLTALRRNLEVDQEMYKFLMTKLEESRILKASTTTDKRIVDSATTPPDRSSPKRGMTLLYACFLGLALGVAAAFLRRAIDPRIRDEEEAKTLSGLPIYGVVPDLHVLGMSRPDDRTPEAIWDTPKGPAAEAFRTIRTNVEFAQVGEESIRVIQVTSSEASEGKSTIIANLGIALAKAGHRILVVDLDLRRPSLHRTWKVPRTPGISDHVVGQAGLTIHRVERYDLDFASAGNEPPESQRLLSSAKLAQLIKQWRESYDYVLLDTPPLLVADSLVISRMSDMVLFVVRPRHCRRTHLKLAQSTHEKMELVKGLIINGVATRRGGYYHYYRGSYYGSKTSDTQEPA